MMTLLDQIDAMEPWVMDHEICPLCKKTATWFVGSKTGGRKACRDCFQKRLELDLIRKDINKWTLEQFSFSLSLLGPMKDRLLALIHFSTFKTMESLPGLMVENMGFDSAHPLALFVRQKAYEACFYFTDHDKMLKTITGIEKFSSWHQKANMIKLGYALDSNNPKVIEFIELMACDPSPNVRSHVVGTIWSDKKLWAKTLLRKLSYDKNPLVREAWDKRTSNQDKAFDTMIDFLQERETRARAIANANARGAIKQKPAYNRTENIVKRYCDFPMQKKVYELYLGHIPDLLDKKKYPDNELAALKMNTKDACVRLLAAAVSDDFLFNTILEKLPEQVVNLLYLFVWECEKYETQTAEQKLAQLMQDQSCDIVDRTSKKMSLLEAVEKDPAYFMFQVKKNYAYFNRDTHSIFINFGLQHFIQKRLPPPDFGSLSPVADIQSRVEQIHENSLEIFRQLPVILTFIAQDNLKFNKSGNKILLGSLKKMATACKIDEFYANGGNELNFLKTKLLADFFCCMSPWKPKDLEDLPGFIKKKINQYFSVKEFEDFRSRNAFGHIKRQMEECDSNDKEKMIRKNFKKILCLLPVGEWISTSNLARVAFYDGIDVNPFSESYELSGLYITINDDTAHSGRNKEYIHSLSIYDVITLPFVKTMMFLLGALGIVDLGYSTPENTICRQYNKPWLSVYDGLKYVRLTDFGNFIIGRKKRFANDIIIQSTKVEIDEHKTMLSIYGEDPIRQMALEAVGQKINSSSYMVNYKSFLKDCHTHKDVENKIQFFRDNIVEKPPAVWEDFFKEVLARMNPLEPVPAMSVFRVKPARELLSLLTRDKVLKKYVIRAENHHILVRTSDYSKVRKRLASWGFFIS